MNKVIISTESSWMAKEALQAGEVLRAQLENSVNMNEWVAQLRTAPPNAFITVARGSSDHAAGFWSYLLMQRLGILTVSLPLSLVTLHRSPLRVPNTVAVGLSQSGASPDLVETLRYLQQAGAYAVACVNQVDSPMAECADRVLPVLAGQERSVAATKSCLGMMTLAAQWVALWTEDQALLDGLHDLAEVMSNAVDSAEYDGYAQALAILAEQQRVLIIGRGLLYSVASESALKMKETCAIQSEPFSVAEVRHGPMRLIEDEYPLVVFITPGQEQAQLVQFCLEMRQRGAQLVVFSVLGAETVKTLREAGCVVINTPLDACRFPESVCSVTAPLVVLQRFYLFVARLSQARGLDPDRPLFLNKVTQTR